MNTTILKNLILVIAIGLFSQIAMAQNQGNGVALKQIADIVAGLSHRPSDSDLTTLNEIIGNSGLAQGVRAMGSSVASIEHSANEEGKGAMEAIQSNAQAPDRARALADIIGSFNHSASDDAKAQLAELFP